MTSCTTRLFVAFGACVLTLMTTTLAAQAQTRNVHCPGGSIGLALCLAGAPVLADERSHRQPTVLPSGRAATTKPCAWRPYSTRVSSMLWVATRWA